MDGQGWWSANVPHATASAPEGSEPVADVELHLVADIELHLMLVADLNTLYQIKG